MRYCCSTCVQTLSKWASQIDWTYIIEAIARLVNRRRKREDIEWEYKIYNQIHESEKQNACRFIGNKQSSIAIISK